MPGSYHVEITEEASSNLDDIFTHVARGSPQNASGVLERLIDAIFSLRFLPHRYKVYRRGKHPQSPVRSMPVPPFVVYYRVIDPDQMVLVLTVLHGRRRRPRSFE